MFAPQLMFLIIYASNKIISSSVVRRAVYTIATMKSVVFLTFLISSCWIGANAKIFLSCELAQIFSKNNLDRSLIPHCNTFEIFFTPQYNILKKFQGFAWFKPKAKEIPLKLQHYRINRPIMEFFR